MRNTYIHNTQIWNNLDQIVISFTLMEDNSYKFLNTKTFWTRQLTYHIVEKSSDIMTKHFMKH